MTNINNRRSFIKNSAAGLSTAATASMLNHGFAAGTGNTLSSLPHYKPKAKRIIYLFMSGAPSQMDMFDYKPKMREYFDKDLPDSVRQGQRLTTMTSKQKRFPIAPSIYDFKQYGQSGAWISELLPHTAKMVDDISIIKSVYTEAINHDPAITYIQTGNQVPGKPSLGSWLSYGLGSPNDNLPPFVVLTATWTGRKDAQALYQRLWGSGFLPSKHAGVALRSAGDPVLYLSNPKGITDKRRRSMLNALAQLNQENYNHVGDPEIQSRISQYEMAYRMQSSIPGITNIDDEPQHILDMYGPDVKKKEPLLTAVY